MDSDSDSLETCGICLSQLSHTDVVYELKQCNHKFHAKCIAEALQYSAKCPICRKVFLETEDSDEDMDEDSHDDSDEDDLDEDSEDDSHDLEETMEEYQKKIAKHFLKICDGDDDFLKELWGKISKENDNDKNRSEMAYELSIHYTTG